MSPEHAIAVAVTFERLRKKRQVTYAHVARAGGLHRNTVWTIAHGSVKHISVDTLARLAIGLADYVYLPGIDKEYLAYALAELGAAAGLSGMLTGEVQRELADLLVALVGDRAAANAWVALIVQKRTLSAEQITAYGAESPPEPAHEHVDC